MKTKTSVKKVTENYKTFYCGYCDLQNIFKRVEPNYYNSGIYGWNCDIYIFGNIAIVTGYRNLHGIRIDSSLIEKYDQKAKNIIKRVFQEDIDQDLQKNVNEFIAELKRGFLS